MVCRLPGHKIEFFRNLFSRAANSPKIDMALASEGWFCRLRDRRIEFFRSHFRPDFAFPLTPITLDAWRSLLSTVMASLPGRRCDLWLPRSSFAAAKC